jgi:hypothetical protein
MAAIHVPQSDWCQCQSWRLGQHLLANHRKMNFCPFCGESLVKVREKELDIEQQSFVLPRQGYFWVPRPAEPERVTVFHILKDGEYQFLCGMDKPVGIEPAADIPHIERCCRTCLERLRSIPTVKSKEKDYRNEHTESD